LDGVEKILQKCFAQFKKDDDEYDFQTNADDTFVVQEEEVVLVPDEKTQKAVTQKAVTDSSASKEPAGSEFSKRFKKTRLKKMFVDFCGLKFCINSIFRLKNLFSNFELGVTSSSEDVYDSVYDTETQTEADSSGKDKKKKKEKKKKFFGLL